MKVHDCGRWYANDVGLAALAVGEEAALSIARGETIWWVEHREELKGKYVGDHLVLATSAGLVSIFGLHGGAVTCIVGAVEAGRHVVIGADTMGLENGALAHEAMEESKVWRSGEWVLAMAGPLRHLQALRQIPMPGVEPDAALTGPEAVSAALHKWVELVKGKVFAGSDPYTLLIAHGTRLWYGGSAHFTMEKTRRAIWAIGDAGWFALGAMDTFRDRNAPAASVAEEGLRVGCRLGANARLPANFMTTSGESWRIEETGRVRY